MSVLFCVTVLDPNAFNALLFISFMCITMGNNTQMLVFWRITLMMISAILFSQYSLRVFASNNFLIEVKHHQRNNLICLSGLLKCEDDAILAKTFSNLEFINLKLYLPYYVLLITFIVSYFILTSENYQELLEENINREIELQKQAKEDA